MSKGLTGFSRGSKTRTEEGADEVRSTVNIPSATKVAGEVGKPMAEINPRPFKAVSPPPFKTFR